MDIVVILLLGFNIVLCFNSIINLNEMEEVIDKHNAVVDVVNSLNRRISDIEKERDETKGTS